LKLWQESGKIGSEWLKEKEHDNHCETTMQSSHRAAEIGQLSEAELTPLVNEALKNCGSVLALSRSPLANSALVTPALVRDSASPTAEERAYALRLVLQWAVNRLGPGQGEHPFDVHRPFDDPTWRDSRWWRYNILRHRYLEPLHPDDFVADGRFTETIIALTGIPSTDMFFAERNRAIREVARWLHRQIRDGEADPILQQLALEEVLLPLRRERAALQLMNIAATFIHVFPRRLLIKLATAEGITESVKALNLLVRQRYLLSGDDDANLWLSPVLRTHIYSQQNAAVARSRHERIARYYARRGDETSLVAAHHFLEAKQETNAARILLAASEQLIEELEINELRTTLQHFRPGLLADEMWYDMQLLLADLHRMAGDHDAAVATCRAALKSASDQRQQGQIYRRLGKLYEQRNQHHAINYYRQAIERFEPGDPELAELLKDRGWLYILRRDWMRADADLTDALRHALNGDQAMVADIYDALSGLHRRQKAYDVAVDYARTALSMREKSGNPLHVAKSLGNLGLIYNDQEDYANAIYAYEEAVVTYRKLNNRELMLSAMLNIGSSHHLAGQLSEAVDIYLACVEIGVEIEHTWVQIMAHSNLAEAYAQLGEDEVARQQWRAGHALSRQHGFDDQVTYFAELRSQFPALQAIEMEMDMESAVEIQTSESDAPVSAHAGGTAPGDLDPDEQVAWRLVRKQGYITAKRLMESAVVSKATATRKLASMVARGLLRKEGKGRGTRYVASDATGTQSTAPGTATRKQRQALVVRLQQQLGRRKTILSQQYDLAGLGVIDPSLHIRAIIPGALNMVARFDQLPDVLAFFALENYLAEVSGQPANLLLEAALPPEDQVAVNKGTAWIWG